MKREHDVKKVEFEKERMVIFVDGRHFEFDLKKISRRLWKASEKERNVYEVSPTGYGIHWPLIDEDLSIDALLKFKN